MKKFLIIIGLFLILSPQTWVNADNHIVRDNIYSMFGIELNTHISKYADSRDGKIADTFTSSDTIYTFTDKTLVNINRSRFFKRYLVRTDQYFRVLVVNASKAFPQDKKFTDKVCKNEQNKFKNIFSHAYNLVPSKFKTFYRKGIDEKTPLEFLWNDLNYTYKNDSGEYRLMLICMYRMYKGKILSVFFTSWMTEKYYRRNVINRFKKIDKFDTNFISKYLLK